MGDQHEDDPEVPGERELTYEEFEQYLAARAPEGGAASRQVWGFVAKVIALVLIVGGLTVIGVLLLFMSALNSWGSNK